MGKWLSGKEGGFSGDPTGAQEVCAKVRLHQVQWPLPPSGHQPRLGVDWVDFVCGLPSKVGLPQEEFMAASFLQS